MTTTESQSIDIPFTKHVLANGLQVIVHEDHDCPLASVNLWYHVGSKDEVPGRTGFAHLFEHLMFEASKHFGTTYFEIIQRAGGQINGSTNTDRTNYWELVPSGAVELALWMEADRMLHMLPSLTDQSFETQRGVVLNERRQNYENRPYGLAIVALTAALFPPEHPYHWITIGAPDDIRNATIDDVRAFFQRYYHPANASLAIAGDVDADAVLRLAEEYFLPCQAGGAVVPPAPSPARPVPVRLVFEDRVELPRLYMAWPTPAMYRDGDADLDLLAEILASDKPSRLYRRLVYEERIATDVSASQNSRELEGFFTIAATAVPGVPLDRLERAICEEVAALVADGPTSDERSRTVVQVESAFVARLQSVGGFGGRADQLNGYNVMLGNPGGFSTDLQRYVGATDTSMKDAAVRYLGGAAPVVLSVVPVGGLGLAARDSALVDVS